MIMRQFSKSPMELNKELLQAHFMDLDMFNRFTRIPGLRLFFEDDRIMSANKLP